MKNFKLLLIAFIAVVGVSSCMKDDNTYDNSYEENLKRIDTLLKKQAPILKAYAEANFGENAKIDSPTGIWYEVFDTEVDSTYEYISTSNSYVPVTATLKYKGELMDKTVFDEKTSPTQLTINNVIPAWIYVFYPKSSNPGGLSGILPHGLLKGNKIRFIAPSPYCYDNVAKDKIPADSPLVFTVEVTDLKSAN